MKKILLVIFVLFGLFLFFFFTPSPSLARNQTSTVGVRLAYEGQFINCEEETYLIRCLTPECDDYSEIYWDEPHGDEQGYYYFVFYNVPYGEYAVHIKGCDHAKGRTLLTTGETRIIVDQPDELEDVVVVETEPCSCEPPPPPVGPPDLPPDYFPAGALQCRPELTGDRDSRPYRNLECDLCNITGLFCPSCATSFTVFDEVKWQRKERDLVCEGEGNPDWKITPWEGSIAIDPTQTKIPFVGKKRVEEFGRADKVHEDEELYLADYFEGTHEYYRRYPLSISFPILGDIDILHGVNSNLRINYQGVFRKLAPMAYQDKLKKQMIERAQATQVKNIHEGGVHNYELNYVRRICWHAPFFLDVLVLIADKIIEHAKVPFDLDPLAITHYCLYGYNTTTDYALIESVKGILDLWNNSLPRILSFLKIPYFYQTELAQKMLTLEDNYPPDPSEENYAEKWKDWKFKNPEKKEISDAGKLWEVLPMFSREDTPGMIIPYLGSKPLDTFEITNPENQVEKVPHVARLYETTQKINKIMTPYQESAGISQKKTEPIVASAGESVLGEKVLLAQNNSGGNDITVAASCSKNNEGKYVINWDLILNGSNECKIIHASHWSLDVILSGPTGGYRGSPDHVTRLPSIISSTWYPGGPFVVSGNSGDTFSISARVGLYARTKETCPKDIYGNCSFSLTEAGCGGCGATPPAPACGLAEAMPVPPCQKPAITDTNPNDDLCCKPININLEAKDMFNDYPYTPCDYSCGPTGTSLCNPECNTWEYRTVNRKIGINLLHPYLSEIWDQTGNAETFGIFNYFRPASIPEFSDIDAASQISYSYEDTSPPTGGSVTPETGKFYFPYLGGVQLAKEWVTRALMPWKE